MMDWYDGGVGWGGWVMMTFGMVVFWAVVAFVVVTLFRSTSGPADRPVRRERDALEILDERFARGEIDEAEYHARRDALGDADRGHVE